MKTTEQEKQELANRFNLLVVNKGLELAAEGEVTINTNQENTFFEFDFTESATEEFIEEAYESVIKYSVLAQAFKGVPLDEIEVKITSIVDGKPLDEFVVDKEYLLNETWLGLAENGDEYSEGEDK